MSAPKKLTDEQIRFARLLISQRRAAMALVRIYPTTEELAEQLGCTTRHLSRIVTGRTRKVLTQDISP